LEGQRFGEAGAHAGVLGTLSRVDKQVLQCCLGDPGHAAPTSMAPSSPSSPALEQGEWGMGDFTKPHRIGEGNI